MTAWVVCGIAMAALLSLVVMAGSRSDKAALLAAIRKKPGRLGRELHEEVGTSPGSGYVLLSQLEGEGKITSMPEDPVPPSTARRRRYWPTSPSEEDDRW